MTDATTLSKPRLTKAGVGRMLTVLLTLAATAAVFFLTAGTFEVSRGWLYYGGLLAYLVVATAVIVLVFPEVIETLRRELDGYDAFTKKTRYRLLPGVW
jgi:uncharacterized membrane protein YcjF (UPF0283 family)